MIAAGARSAGESGRGAVAAVIPNFNGARWLDGCLGSVGAQTRAFDRVIVVDNGSSDESLSLLAEHGDIETVAVGHNSGFAAAANRGMHAAEVPFVALINTDVELDPRWLERMLDAIHADPGIGSVACKMLDMSDPHYIYDAGDRLRRDGVCEQRGRFERDDGRYDERCEIFGACAGAALYRRDAVLAVGAFDERFFAYMEDVELSLRLRSASWRCLYEPVPALHAGGGTAGELTLSPDYWVARNTLLIVARWFPWRWFPWVAYRQAGWAWHALRERRLARHLRGAVAALVLLPEMLRERRDTRSAAHVPIAAVVEHTAIRSRRRRL